LLNNGLINHDLHVAFYRERAATDRITTGTQEPISSISSYIK
jgi:hypothetical protein